MGNEPSNDAKSQQQYRIQKQKFKKSPNNIINNKDNNNYFDSSQHMNVIPCESEKYKSSKHEALLLSDSDIKNDRRKQVDNNNHQWYNFSQYIGLLHMTYYLKFDENVSHIQECIGSAIIFHIDPNNHDVYILTAAHN